MDNKDPKALVELLQALSGGVTTRKEMLAIAKQLLELFKRREMKMTEMHMQMMREIAAVKEELKNGDAVSKEELNKKLAALEASLNRTLEALVRKVDMKIAEVKDGENGLDADEDRVAQKVLEQIKLPEQKEVILDGPKELRAKLADDLKPIQELKAELDKLKQAVSNIPRGPLSGRYVNTPVVDTFTGDGSTKEFYLEKQPKDLSKVLLHGRDFPYVLMHGDGFTISGKLLTIASDFDAPTNNFVVSYQI